ncbi:polyunsaturated fatty acid lipoxygenase ALOX15B-like isoform X5 [Dendrobates tinctorius]|uniref:polyunsaturated fatty acid lipoxygenase ALOX15B-like isoform X5 n=1 Tax=Dendrobates tinctorius TaxID=92724 RepID=UPI003CCA3706
MFGISRVICSKQCPPLRSSTPRPAGHGCRSLPAHKADSHLPALLHLLQRGLIQCGASTEDMGSYKVTVATGEDLFCGTIDSVSISLIGEKGEGVKRKLSHLWFHGSVCDFDLTIEQDIGKLLFVRLCKETHVFRVDDSWYVLYVHVTSPNGKLYQFPMYQWISSQTNVVVPHGIDEVSRIWNEDSFFGYQYLNGVNPMLIKKCTKLLENFPVTSSMVASSLGTSTDLEKEMQNGNVFMADYKILHGVPNNDLINGKPQYIAAPMCLLWKDPQDQLLPIAIQLGQTPGEQTPIFLPSDNEWDWTLAKIWVRNAEFQVHEIVYHLLHTHLFAEVFNIATHRQLPHNHPVYKLVVPHLRYTLDINTLARIQLISPGGVFDKYTVLGMKGINALLEKAMHEVTYSGLCLPDDIVARGLESIPNYYYRDDGKMIWEAMESFVSGIVHYYYKSDESVQMDPELQDWVAEIYERGFLKLESSGIPSSLETVSSLVRYLTMVVFRCSAGHAAVNLGQFDFFSWMPNGPPSMKSPPPSIKGATTLQTILDSLSDVNTTVMELVAVWQLSTEPLDRKRLGNYHEVHFIEETPKKHIQEFKEKLAEISKIINEKNQSRRLSYLYLDPNHIENSISI